MGKGLLKFSLGLFSIFFLFQCEKDDICLSSIVESPDLVLLMLDAEDLRFRKTPSGFAIRAIGTDSILPGGASDSLSLPLKIQENNVQFEFIVNQGTEEENRDTLQINYQRFDTFINGACGYRSTYILETPPALILNPGDNWIKGFTILKDTIADETRAHLGILH